MASLRIGRITDGSVLGTIDSVAVSGESFTLSGKITLDGNQIHKAKAVRDQINGLTHPDEPFVPLRISDDPTLDGMVKVRAASCQLNGGALELGRFPWSITADRVPGGALPNVESTLIGGFRTNTAGVAGPPGTVTPWHAVPGATLDYYDGVNIFSSPWTLNSQSGTVSLYTFAAATGRKTARMSIPPANWYDGAACIEQPYPDGTYYPVGGRLMYSGLSSTGWRIGNGIIRISPGASGTLNLEAWDSATSAWGAVHNFTLSGYDGTTIYAVNRINTVSILRNSPEECRIRITPGLTSGGANYGHRTMLDIKIRRGARVAECRWTTFGSNVLGIFGTTAVEAGSGFTGGVNTTVADAQSNYVALLTPTFATMSFSPTKMDSTGVGIRQPAWSFGFGVVLGGAGAANPNRPTDLRDQYFAPYGDRMTVVGW